jgi:mono/diheme cytochrome c family protein/PAS domain-containing protein
VEAAIPEDLGKGMRSRLGGTAAIAWVLSAGLCRSLGGGISAYASPQQTTAVAGSSASSSPAAQIPEALTAADYENAVKPLIEQNCVGCHNPVKLKGDLDLQLFLSKSADDALKNRDVFELVVQKLRAGEMPPEGRPRPPPQQIAAATAWIEQQYALLDSKAPLNPGRLTAHRLNRYEYNNTVRDLVDVNLHFADDFPPDPYGYGFDNIGDVLSLSPMLTEKYLKAAERVAQAAIPLAPPKSVAAQYEPEKMGQRQQADVEITHDFPADGVYTLRYQWSEGVAKGVVMTGHFYIDGVEVSRQPMAMKPNQETAMTARDIPVTQGPHVFEGFMEVAPDSQQPAPVKGTLPTLKLMQIIGPTKSVPPEQTASYKRIFFNGPPGKRRQAEYNREIIERLAHRAYRRPVTKAELGRLVHLTKLVRSHGGSFEEGIQIALEAILMSPDFLFRIEQDPAAEGSHRISDIELASRLSYFLWSSMPDDELLSAAEKGQLHLPEVLHAQVRRMLADPKARSLATNFGGEWLQTRNLQFQKPDRKAFREYDVQLKDAMRTETEMFFQAIITEDRSILDFLDGKFTFVNERLAALYGIPGVQGREFRRVSLEGTERSGVITQASVLTASSYPTRTSPVIRGKWLLENILNTPPPAPPANVPALDTKDVGTAASVRERLEAHRANPACSACHSKMDPLGFALENYDAIGRWRSADGQVPIDAKGTLPDGTTFSGAGELKALLMAKSGQFVRGFTEKMLTYAIGRGLESYDKPAVEKIARQVESKGDRFSAVVDGIVDSAPFQMRQREVTKVDTNQRAMEDGRPASVHGPNGE